MKTFSQISKQKKQIILVGLLSVFGITHSYANSTNDGTAYLIFDNTAGKNSAAIMTNMSTNQAPDCNRDNALKSNSLNCFALGSNDVQVVQNDGAGNPVTMIGVDNSESTSYGNLNNESRRYLFTPGKQLFDLQEFRDAADNISNLSTNLPDNTYGSITYQKFLENVANGKTMYGIVRVKMPLRVEPEGTTDSNGDIIPPISTCDGEPIEACGYRCGPWVGAELIAGYTMCAVTLPLNAQINVKGSLMFDWVNGRTGEPILSSQFPSDSSIISLAIGIPLNINAANTNSAPNNNTLASINDIQTITGSNQCSSGSSPCEVAISANIPWSLVPSESKEMYEYKMRTPLTEASFNTLTKTDKYHLLFPSGYANGWHDAFEELNISKTIWNSYNFDVEVDPSTPSATAASIISKNSVRAESFSDIPALIYTGGLIKIRHHTNISGLVYAAQAIEISQNGAGHTPLVPSLQYFNGAIIVRDGFYFEAIKEGGITLISNNPGSYSNTKVLKGPGINGNFNVYDETSSAPIQGNGNVDNSVFTGTLSVTSSSASKGTQWVEIRPK